MAKSSPEWREPTADRRQLDRSMARESELASRYRHIRSHMNVTQALEKLDGIENAGFQDLLAQLADLSVVIGADAVLPRHLARRQERFGLTLVVPGHEPLIWLNLLKHDNVAGLVDTVVHEAVHSTIRHLGRLPRTPEPDEAIASYGEEVVALAGANLILRRIKFSARREIARNMIALANCKTVLGQLGCSERFLRDRIAEAEVAASFLTDFGIDVAAPTLEAIQSRAGRK
ncbi:hypothetical protein E0H22_24870 [Rhodopseudomonas boonkerdii]|jgi:hypothetical protein|uniref:hypothetical protein n=1 Tax=Hyphomicrobiales TaxID=356 RepID=UPI00124DD37F|nr:MULTISPECIES: hypothetical protein [Hyphomicrobiales]KAB2760781.1 hypothetical protein F9K81_04915 [Brucella anthropi]MCX7322355.1 hypothetical protein [Hyphomicrobiales bacterium]UGV24876.1 hypothetical protein E0H22_03800 [Rhodopseudomonas boonkerdii]UGV28600.1 hypothetical protein E0H22_24870 [Rhodopseudomonas boonkerdii]